MSRIHFLLPALALVGTAHAQTFPPHPTTGTVYDGAGLLSASDKATIDALSHDFKRDTGAPIVVAALPSLESVGAKEEGIERYSTQLFDHWRIGNRSNDGGILLVVAKADHKARIELGKDWKHDYDAGAHEVMQGTILPAFKVRDYGGGIVRGCQALAGLANRTNAATETKLPVPEASTSLSESSGTGLAALIIGFVLCCVSLPIIILAVVFRAVKRQGARGGLRQPYGGSFGSSPQGPFYDRRVDDGDDAFAAGVVAGQIMSEPTYDPTPFVDPGPAFDNSSTFDNSSSTDSGPSSDSDSSSDSGGSFDSGSSGGGGDSGSW